MQDSFVVLLECPFLKTRASQMWAMHIMERSSIRVVGLLEGIWRRQSRWWCVISQNPTLNPTITQKLPQLQVKTFVVVVVQEVTFVLPALVSWNPLVLLPHASTPAIPISEILFRAMISIPSNQIPMLISCVTVQSTRHGRSFCILRERDILWVDLLKIVFVIVLFWGDNWSLLMIMLLRAQNMACLDCRGQEVDENKSLPSFLRAFNWTGPF